MRSISSLCTTVILLLNFSNPNLASATDGPTYKDQGAPNTISFNVTTSKCCGGEEADPHAVHGLETDDQAFILSGKSVDSKGAHDGFVVRFSDFREEEGILWLLPEEDYSYEWVYRFGSDLASSALNKWIKTIIGGDYVVHGLRHSLRDRLRAVECPSDIIDQIGGWTTTGIGHAYGKGYSVEILAKWMERIKTSFLFD